MTHPNSDTSSRTGGAALPWWAILFAILLVFPTFAMTAADPALAGPSEPADEQPEEPNDETVEAEPAEPEEPAKAEVPWVKDIQAAKAQADKEGKDLFINFTGSDWCVWCERLDDQVLTHVSFLDAATQDFVFLFLDFPRSEELKNEVLDAKQNEELKNAFEVAGFPTIVLATADGHPYARTGYKEGGPEAYLEHLAELQQGGEAVKKLLADETHEDLEALKAAFPVLADQGFLSFSAYDWTLAAAEKADPDGKLELLPLAQKERERQLAKAEEEELMKLFPKTRGMEPDRDTILKFVLGSKYLQGPRFLNLSFGLTDWLLGENRTEEAQELLARIRKDPLATSHPQAIRILEQFTTRVEEQLAAPAEDDDESEDDDDDSEDHDDESADDDSEDHDDESEDDDA